MTTSSPLVGDKVWFTLDGENKVKGTIQRIRVSSTLKNGSDKVYSIELKNSGEILKTRLLHLKWGLSSKRRKQEANPEEEEEEATLQNKKKLKTGNSLTNAPAATRSILTIAGANPDDNSTAPQRVSPVPPHRLILAPMVGGSELAFRLLCRKYGADLAYTPMMDSKQFASDPEYRLREFQTCATDRPLVAHFSANDPEAMFAAAKLAEPFCDAVDLNLGCPQRVAHAGHFGSFLLGSEDRALVLRIVSRLAQTPLDQGGLRVPVFVKVRLLDTVSESISLVEQLCGAGASLVAIHARYRVNLVGRSGPGARDGAAKLDQVAAIKEAMRTVQGGKFAHVPLVANGNITCWRDCVDNLRETRADGLMSAEGILDDPALFWGQHSERKKLQALAKSGGHGVEEAAAAKFELDRLPPSPPSPQLPVTLADTEQRPSRVELALEYLELVKAHPVKQSSVVFHVRRMCRDELASYQSMEDLVTCTSLAQVVAVVERLQGHQLRGDYVFDPHKEKRAKEAAERKKREEGKRKEYEARMVRKAKREGKADVNHYLNPEALKPPTTAQVAHVKALTGSGKGVEEEEESSKKQAQLKHWRAKWPQHCFAHHMNSNSDDDTNNNKNKEAGGGGCPRDRRCAFLHVDVVVPDDEDGQSGGGGAGGKGGGKRRFEEAPSWLEENGG